MQLALKSGPLRMLIWFLKYEEDIVVRMKGYSFFCGNSRFPIL